jgi:hypothetical protein
VKSKQLKRINWQCRVLCIALIPFVYVVSLGPVARWAPYDSRFVELYWQPAILIERVPVVGRFVGAWIEQWLDEDDWPQTTR